MHGLRCDPTLLGWTRLLDEWIVGLTRYNRRAPSDPVCWEDRGRTSSTLADAATRVRSFAYREADIRPTVPLGDGTLRFELQGRMYCVSIDQRWPSTPDVFKTSAAEWLEGAHANALAATHENEVAVGAVFITPRMAAGADAGARFEAGDRFIVASRAIRCSGCAFSFPNPQELDRYRYGNDELPGALLLVQSHGLPPRVST